MTGKVVSEHANLEIMANGTQRVVETEALLSGNMTLSNVQVASTVTFGVALLQVCYFPNLVILNFFWFDFCLQLVMFTLRLGAVSSLLSDNLVSGFTCASAFHVVSSQLKDLLGLSTTKRRGNFSFVFVSLF